MKQESYMTDEELRNMSVEEIAGEDGGVRDTDERISSHNAGRFPFFLVDIFFSRSADGQT